MWLLALTSVPRRVKQRRTSRYAAHHRGPRASRPSGEPALAAPVMLHVAVALAAAGGEAEVEFLHVVIGAQTVRRPVHDDAAVLQDVAVIGVAERDVGVLLGEEEAHLALAVEAAD